MLLDILHIFTGGNAQVLMIVQVLVSLFLAVLFLQSGLDKVFNWSGNLEWLNGHFSKTPLKDVVSIMLLIVTIAEVLAGGLCGFGVFGLIFLGTAEFALYGAMLSALSTLMLFFGQRIAQDYAGAATLVSYFLVSILAILVLNHA